MNYPPIQALRALDCFVKTGSINRTAEELNLTRSAVSYQLRQLEERLKFRLFERENNLLTVTPQGLAYALAVRRALDTLSTAAVRNASLGLRGTLNVSCTPGFGGGWLSSCIARFLDQQPDIRVNIKTPKSLSEVSDKEVDLFISYGDGRWEDMEVVLLMEVRVTPVCSPILLNRHSLLQPSDLRKVHLLDVNDQQHDWEHWLSIAGEGSLLAYARLKFSDWHLSYSAALYAQGIALGDVFTCRAALEGGLLVQPFELAVKSQSAYYLVVPPAKAELPAVIAFSNWLQSELVRNNLTSANIIT
ncbi:LysR substrate-binding domain-containing protein [Rhizobium azibense]|uniref:LysR family glycine cleavage system transcriptional activator n=1 Tax=Rhizobium azibense TaxID=1136135 RepID=A0A4R3RJB7_9HYPH|nr:LysR substrate-binding domain-containing protein [Rhizobium azibense]TCU31466.1 LysR family glycine cleavage system transcriptional activator [Rhizobium azibense]